MARSADKVGNIVKHISKEPLKCIARVTLLLFAEYDYSIFVLSISRVDQFGLLTLDGNTTYRSNVSGSHRALNVASPLFIGGVSDVVSLAPQALAVQGELHAALCGHW